MEERCAAGFAPRPTYRRLYAVVTEPTDAAQLARSPSVRSRPSSSRTSR